MRTLAQKAPETAPAKSAPLHRPHVEQIREISPTQQLQRRMGNQALQRMLQGQASKAKEDAAAGESARIQPKLTINTPGDIYEQEADRVAEQVMRMPEPQSSSAGEAPVRAGGKNSHAQVQTKTVQANDSGGAVAPPIVHDVLRSSGQPLDAATRAFMEPRFGQDFSGVRVHTDARAAESAAAVNATAYTVGRDVVFGRGQFTPHTGQGQALLAHELAHVAQNSRDTVRRQDEGESWFPRLYSWGIGTVNNKTSHTFDAEASQGKEGGLVKTKLPPGAWGGSHPLGKTLNDIDFVYPSPTTPINGATTGAFKIGSNDATISPDPKKKNNSVIDDFTGYESRSPLSPQVRTAGLDPTSNPATGATERAKQQAEEAIRKLKLKEIFAPTTGTKNTKLKGTYGDFSVDHGLTKVPDKTKAGQAGFGEYSIKITMTPNAKTNPSKIGFVQVYRQGKTGGGWAMKEGENFLTAEEAKRTEPKEGWAVDRANPTRDKTPFYGMYKDAGALKQYTTTTVGKFKGSDAMLSDAPAVADPDRMEFTSTAMDISSGAKFGAVAWGYTFDSASKTYSQTTPELMKDDSDRAKGRERAIETWDKVVATKNSGIDKVPHK